MTYLFFRSGRGTRTPEGLLNLASLWDWWDTNFSTPQYILYSVAVMLRCLRRERASCSLLHQPSIFGGDVRSRTGVYKNVNDTLLSGCIGFEVFGTSTNYHKGGRLYIRRPIDTGQNSWLNQWPLPGSKRLGSKCVTVCWCCTEAAWNCTNLVSQLLVKILSVYCLIHLRVRIIPTTKYHQLKSHQNQIHPHIIKEL